MRNAKTNGERHKESHPHPMWTVKDVAELLKVSQRHVWRLRSAGKLPQPIRIGRAVRWPRQSIAAFIEKGGAEHGRS